MRLQLPLLEKLEFDVSHRDAATHELHYVGTAYVDLQELATREKSFIAG